MLGTVLERAVDRVGPELGTRMKRNNSDPWRWPCNVREATKITGVKVVDDNFLANGRFGVAFARMVHGCEKGAPRVHINDCHLSKKSTILKHQKFMTRTYMLYLYVFRRICKSLELPATLPCTFGMKSLHC